MLSPGWVEAGAVVVLLVFVRLSAGVRLREVAAVAAGAWVGEEVCIRVYTAYRYAPGWTVFVDRVPLAVVLIWPAVVLSARAVQRTTGAPAALVVLFDACLIEPIATHAGLWSWNLPGAFGVPPIGPVGWACYAGAACWLLDGGNGRRRDRGEARGPQHLDGGELRTGGHGEAGSSKAAPPLARPGSLRTVALAPLLAHAAILAAWWGALRWVQAEIPPAAAVAGAAVAGLSAAGVALRAPRLPWREAIPRAAAAALFVALLAAAPDRALLLYAAPFALPWLALLDWRAAAFRSAAS